MTVETIHDDYWCVFLDDPLPRSSTWPPKQATNHEVWRWAKSLGAADEQTTVRLVLCGKDRTSSITSMTARIVERGQPSPKARLCHPIEGVVAPIKMLIDLDEPEPHPYRVLSEDQQAPFFDGTIIAVTPDEPVPVEVTARTASSDCWWVLDIKALVGKRQRVVTATNQGKPFRTSAGSQNVPWYSWVYYDPDHRICKFLGRDEHGAPKLEPVPE